MMQVLFVLFPLLCGAVIGLILISAPQRPETPEIRSFREAMSRLEALQLLGFEDEADTRAIRSAHRRLMRRHHPDRGGTHEKAAAVNLARDVLLRKR